MKWTIRIELTPDGNPPITYDNRDAWLTAQPDEAFKLLRQYPETHLDATPVSKWVNSPKNNDFELIAPATVA